MSNTAPQTVEMGNRDEEAADCEEIGIKHQELSMEANHCVGFKNFEKIRKLGSQLDLFRLRQLDLDHYNTLNPTFLDSMDKCIRITCKLSEPSNPYSDKRDSAEAFVMDGENYKPIGPKDWNEKSFHIFRKLEYVKLEKNVLHSSLSFLNGISTQLGPYIKTLRLSNNTIAPFQFEDDGKTWAEFVNGFPSMRNLEIDLVYNYLVLASGISPVDELEIELADFKLKPKIKIYTNYEYEKLLTKFGTKENMSFELEFSLTLMNPNALENVVQNFGNLTNVTYKTSTDFLFLRSLNRLQQFTRNCIELDSQIKHLEFKLHCGEGMDYFQEGDQPAIRNCFAQLSPYVNEMTIVHSEKMEPTWDILPRDLEWPKLTKLFIHGYEHPLEILKHCSKLEKLELNINYDLCIFSNTQQTEKENLLEYFGNLGCLTNLTLTRRIGDKIDEGNELDEYLKLILPQLKEIKYRAPWII